MSLAAVAVFSQASSLSGNGRLLTVATWGAGTPSVVCQS